MGRRIAAGTLALCLTLGACTPTEGDLLQTIAADLGAAADAGAAPLCTTELLSSTSCTPDSELGILADEKCAAAGLIRVDLILMTTGCTATSARSASATCCPHSRPPRCTLEQQRPADKLCRSGVELIAAADKACAVAGRHALIDDLLDYCQSGLWLAVRYWCCE